MSAPFDPDYYDKIGAYRTQSGKGPITVEWSNVRFFQGGSPGGATATPTPTPAPTPTPCTSCVGFSGYYRIMARHSGKAVVVQSASLADGADVIQWTYGGSAANDEWELRGIGSGFYRVINRHSGKDMVVQSASTANGANVFQYAYGGSTTNDEWQPVSLGGGY